MKTELSFRTIRQIKGLSERRRMPRLGKIRLGILVKRSKTAKCQHKAEEACPFCTHPKEVDYFVVPPEVQKVYGEKPKELIVMFPSDDITEVFPTAYRWYGANQRLRCKGDGEVAIRRWADVEEDLRKEIGGTHDENDLVEIPCPCPRLQSGECAPRGTLMLMLPEVNCGGIYQLDSGSLVNFEEIQSYLDWLRGLVGRAAFVPVKLLREPRKVPDREGRMQTHYYLKFVFEGDIRTVQRLRENARWLPTPRFELPEPIEEGPEPTGPPPVIEDNEAARQHDDVQCEHVGDTRGEAVPASTPGEPTKPTPWMELSAFLYQAGMVPDPRRAGDLIPYPDVAPGLDRWLRMEFKLPTGFEDLKAAAPETQAMVLLRMKAFKDFRSFLLKLGAGREERRAIGKRSGVSPAP